MIHVVASAGSHLREVDKAALDIDTGEPDAEALAHIDARRGRSHSSGGAGASASWHAAASGLAAAVPPPRRRTR